MKCLLSFLLACCCLPVFALTSLSGGIYTNTTLTLANSPYVLTGDLVVFDGVLLTIEPGVEIRVDKDKKIEIRGQISALGTASQPIYVHGNTPVHGKNFWEGFVFVGTTAPLGVGSQADFNYCNVSDAKYCFNMDLAYHGPYRFRNGIFSFNAKVNHDGGMGGVLFDGCTFSNNVIGIHSMSYGGQVSNSLFDANLDGAGGVESLVNCKFTNNTGVAIRACGSISNCEVYYNNVGVESPFNSVSKTFINNKVKHNDVGVRILTYFNGVITFTGNEICSNSGANIQLQTNNNANLANNCWCLTDSSAIHQKVLDGYSDVNRGLVSFLPFNTGCSDIQTIVTTALQADLPAIIVSPNPVYGNTGIKVVWQGIPDKNVWLQLRNIMGQAVPYERLEVGDGYAVVKAKAASGIYYISVSDLATGLTTTKRIILCQ